MEFSKDKYLTLTIYFNGRDGEKRDVYKFDRLGLYYAQDFGLSSWCSYSPDVVVEYKGEKVRLTYKDISEAFPYWMKEKFGDDDEYVELNDILI